MLNLPDELTEIGAAFMDCSGLEKIFIPKNVSHITINLFLGCKSLSAIEVDADNPYFDSRNNCNAIVNSATDEIIAGCCNTIIPEDIISIGIYSFTGSGISNIYIPANVESIGDYAFCNCDRLESVSIDNGKVKMGRSIFSGCINLQDVNLPEGLTTLSASTFNNCVKLTAISIPNSVVTIGSWAFANTGLEQIEIPYGVKTIEDYAFHHCALTNIILPSSLISIGYNSFSSNPISYENGSMTSYMKEPIAIKWFDSVYGHSTVYVPYGTVDK